MLESTIENAIALAALAHQGQTDKHGEAYIFHPLRVMQQMETQEEQIVAVLHDVLEDTIITQQGLRDLGYSTQVVEALSYLTKRDEESGNYWAFIERVCQGPELAIKVKIADLRDNADPARALGTAEHEAKLRTYHDAILYLDEELERRSAQPV